MRPDKIPMQTETSGEAIKDSSEFSVSGISLRQAEMMQYFGVNMNDYDALEKIDAFLEFFPSIDDVRMMDLRLGQDPNMKRIDKIFVQVQLHRQHQKALEEKNLLEQKMNQNYESS